MTGRLGIRDQLPGDRFMATVRNLQYPPYDVRRSRKLAQRCRVMFTGGQLSQLEKYFSIDPYPKLKDRRHIADLMGISERRVQVWFQNRRAKSSRRKASEDDRERQATRIPFDSADVLPHLPSCSYSIPSSIVRHYPMFVPRETDSDEEASIDNGHNFDSARCPPPNGFASMSSGVGFVQSINITTPFSNGIMYSSPIHPFSRPRGSVSSPESDHVESFSFSHKDDGLSLDQILMKLDATESEAVRRLGSFVDCQAKFLDDLRRKCESAFL